MDWQTIAAVVTATAAVGSFLYLALRNFRKDMHDCIDKLDTKIERIQADVSEIKERISFLEAANIYTMPNEPAKPNARSLAAMKMHQRRRQRKLEQQNGEK